MHVQYGVPVQDFRRGRADEATDPLARARVYDLRNYSSQTFWGPFRDNGSGRVDWEMMESIMIVLGFNLKRFHLRTQARFPLWWNLPFDGAYPQSFADSPVKPTLENADAEAKLSEEEREESSKRRELAAKDPYGVTGIWMRVVCFLDYPDLFAYNFLGPHPDPGQPREPNSNDEAIRLLSMRIHVSKIEPPDACDGQALPVVHFQGVCESLHRGWDQNSNSDLTGTVRLTPEGEVRWTSLSIFDGEERWKSEGIQVGGVGSARGVLGTWFDKDYDAEGPAGPTAFWKLSSDESDNEPPLPPRIAAQTMPPSDEQASAFLADFRSRNFDYTNYFGPFPNDDDEEDNEEDDEYNPMGGNLDVVDGISSPTGPLHRNHDVRSTSNVVAD
ncbi:MAG: hypothetical protein M1831_005912 [Alyxoria varia]|nr:MAG: hypothetical protein M1831_005912 [Alyxoria varia]